MVCLTVSPWTYATLLFFISNVSLYASKYTILKNILQHQYLQMWMDIHVLKSSIIWQNVLFVVSTQTNFITPDICPF